MQDLNVSCSFFEIPLDYHNSKAGTGRLAVAKVNATGERLGTVFFNPGMSDEGAILRRHSCTCSLRRWTRSLRTSGHERGEHAASGPHWGELRHRQLGHARRRHAHHVRTSHVFVIPDAADQCALCSPGDIVCFDNVTDYNTFWNGTIELDGIEYTGNFTDPADTKALLAQATVMGRKYTELGKRCQQHPTGKYMKYIGTAATVRDMIALADALDGPGSPVNYAGISYGTLLGAWFVNSE